jgi:glycerol kinase
MKILAIDQGTTSTRGMVTDSADGSVHMVDSVRHAQHFPRPGWVEHDARELLDNVHACIRAAGPVDAIGLANQGESCLAWHAGTGEPLSPVIVWQDNRTAEQVDEIARDGGAERIAELSGLPADAYFSASKLNWIIQHCSTARDALGTGHLRLGTTDAYFLDRLTGTFATDVTTASRTSLMNIRTGRWDEDLCGLFGVPVCCLPEIRPTIGPFGTIDGVPVTASAVDQQAALYGHGCRRPGDAKITFGTGAFVLAVTGERIISASERGLVPTVGWASSAGRTYAVDGGVYDAGAAVEWAMRIGLLSNVEELDRFEARPAVDRGLVFVPALSGLACPHWDRTAGALWIGMSGATSRVDMLQALLEGIALRTAEVLEAMDAEIALAQGIPIDGGLSGSRYFVQFLADVTGRTVIVNDDGERTAWGIAQMAAEGAGTPLGEYPSACTSYRPDPGTDRHGRIDRFRRAIAMSSGWHR